jgi:hypothetical protein
MRFIYGCSAAGGADRLMQPVWLLVTCAVGSEPWDVSCAVGRMHFKGGALGSLLYVRRIQFIGLVQY